MRMGFVAAVVLGCGSSGESHPADASAASDVATDVATTDAIVGNPTRICPPVTSGTFEHYGLPAPASVPSGVTFISDWSQRPIAGGFDGKQAVDDCRIKADGVVTSHGKPAVRVEVDPGDDPLALGTERAELLTMQGTDGTGFAAEGGSGMHLFYATSYYFPTTWDGTFLQGDSDSWSFVNQFYGWTGLAAGRHSASGPQLYWFDGKPFTASSQIALGHWTDFVFDIDWSTGAYRVYRRDDDQTKFAQVLSGTSAQAASCMYYKQGLYRGPDVSGRSDVLWIGPTARGMTFAAVELASFGTTAGF